MGILWVGYQSAFPHTRICKKIHVSVPVPSWVTTLVPSSYPMGI